jgi:DNA-binding response OmpR family regulator
VDPGLPDRDGASLIRVLRAEPRTAQLPILVVFALYREGQLQINGQSAAAPEWIEMPSGGNSLVQAVRQAVKGTRPAGRSRILHVEPDPDVQRITAAIADDFACFEVAGTLWEARARLAQGNFDLVLLELRLADGSGWNLVREIEARSPRPPVVVFSVDDARAQDNPHVAAMLVKAETSNERLLETIRRVLSV